MNLNNRLRILVLILAYLTQFFVSSCDAPRTSRSSSSGTSSSSSTTSTSDEDDDDDEDEDEDEDEDDDDLDVPSGATDCHWSEEDDDDFNYGAVHLDPDESSSSSGKYNICQNKDTETKIYFQIEEELDDEQLCFIPLYTDGSTSTFLGEPRCFTADEAYEVSSLTLYKNRTGYTGYDINAVMMIRDKSYYFNSPFNTSYQVYAVDAYIFCMQWLAVYSDDSYCEAFADGGHYAFHEFSDDDYDE